MSANAGTVSEKNPGVRAKSAKPASPWAHAFRRLRKNRLAVTGLVFLILMGLFCTVGPLFSPYVDERVTGANFNRPPSAQNWLGTDNLGRDILTRLMLAGRISLTVGIASMLLSVLIGSVLGAVAGYYRGIVDQVIMRFADVLMTIPSLPLLIIMGAVLSDLKVPSDYRIYIVMLMLSILGWPGLARLVRSQILTLSQREFMQATEVLGLRDRRKIFVHLLPNTLPLLIVVATLSVAGAILSESVLSYLGLGVTPPTPSWGNMMDSANSLIDFQKRPWLWMPPGVAIFATVIAINLLGEGLRDALDPKMKK
ncbi:ABC transporter permease [Tumebacillus sp. DT12]|uniref:ABC transporter permease n=1 Tax=Tumebacillus lacus TaxID=2995335 RepID=A0ABT3X215_9BACL|nr:oligopeptide ABC transporter permease [Tumebacillus lacus]MCX7570928.1 ABC transporter permease [Tumebacillus lacus]